MSWDKGAWKTGGLAEWIEGDTAFLSVAFTWRLPDAHDRARWYRAQGLRVRAGGPGLFTRKHYLEDVAELGGEPPADALIHHNPMATMASRGCPVGCWFCIVPKMEGRDFTLLPDFPVRPVLCDNNLSALPAEYQAHIISRYQREGVPLLDANSGFEPRTFDEETFARWRVINRGPWRFAYDDLPEREHVERVFKVLAGELAEMLVEALRLTPFAREEFLLAHQPAADPVEQARRTIARSFMGHGASTITAGFKTTFRATSTRSDTHPARSWMKLPAGIAAAAERLRGVAFENRPAEQVIRQYDGEDALHYLDPPYVMATRSGKHRYKHEISADEHVELLDLADALIGSVVISGYASKLYDDRLKRWRRVTRQSATQTGAMRTEVLWINPKAAAKLGEPRQANLEFGKGDDDGESQGGAIPPGDAA